MTEIDREAVILLCQRFWSQIKQGWKKPGFFLKKPAQWVFLGFFVFFWVFWVFLGFFGFFWVFWGFFAQTRGV
jgi:hypothetical protein